MNKIKIVFVALVAMSFQSCASGSKQEQNNTGDKESAYTLKDFYANNATLDEKVNEVFNGLSDKQKVGQMIVQAAGRLGKPDKEIERLIKENIIGGVLLLNGSVEGFKGKINHFDSLAEADDLPPLVYSADAEPSLINRKIEGSPQVPKTVTLNTVEENKKIADKISDQLRDIGILHNYAPVLDLSTSNAAIKTRSYGSDRDSVKMLAMAFVKETQNNNIAATVKHFPGHGLVKGDTHSNLVYIDGEMKEVDMYKPFIENGVISIMVGHIAVKDNPKYDTEGLPSSCSEKIVSGLLRKELGFKGIIITDAMNMGALAKIPNSDFLAVLAGNDMILMPPDEDSIVSQTLAKMKKDGAFRERIYESVKRVIRLKICLGLIK